VAPPLGRPPADSVLASERVFAHHRALLHRSPPFLALLAAPGMTRRGQGQGGSRPGAAAASAAAVGSGPAAGIRPSAATAVSPGPAVAASLSAAAAVGSGPAVAASSPSAVGSGPAVGAPSGGLAPGPATADERANITEDWAVMVQQSNTPVPATTADLAKFNEDLAQFFASTVAFPVDLFGRKPR
jgi:hypothetical protein